MTDFLNQLRKTADQQGGPQKAILQKILETIKNTQVNVLLIGGTGVGKSSTINALFHTSETPMENKAAVGQGANPETMDIQKYILKNMIIHDTPGFGDSTEKDQKHHQKIVELLNENDKSGKPLIDLIFLVLDGGTRDFSSAYKIIKDVVAPNLQNGDKNKLLIGINKADKVMHHTFWDDETNQPKGEIGRRLGKSIRNHQKTHFRRYRIQSGCYLLRCWRIPSRRNTSRAI